MSLKSSNPIRTSPPDAKERLIMLTIALESALRLENWSEATGLFNERARHIEGMQGIDAVTYERVCEIERRYMARLEARRSETLQKLGRGLRASAVRKAYVKLPSKNPDLIPTTVS